MNDSIPGWDKAAKSGLILGLATIAFMLVSTLCSSAFGVAGNFGRNFLGASLGFLLWAGKIAVCILLMRYFLKRLVADHPAADNSDTLKYGIKIALFSSLIVVAYNIADVRFLHPDAYTEAIRQMVDQFAPMMDSNTRAVMEKMTGKMPVSVFLFLFLYDFVWGWVLSSILSRNIPTRDPFAK